MKKVLIVYASAGAGHQKAAEAVYGYLSLNRPDLEIKIIDILDYSTPLLKLLYSKGYIFLISKLPWLWYLFYRLSSFLQHNPVHFRLDYLSSQPFVDLLKREKPRVVISTHFLTSSVLTVFRKKNPDFIFKLISIVTDYTLHPFWIGSAVDLYITACDKVKEELIQRGVESSKIKVYGIPANHKFYKTNPRQEVAEKLQVAPQEFTALIITGAIGLGPIEQIVHFLAGKMQLLVVCGKNKFLYQKLNGMRLPKVKVYPLIDYVDELMSVSDVVLTKAGGLTITESLAKGLPLVFFSSIPGLETTNARVISDCGAGFTTRSVREIQETTLLLKNNPEIYSKTVDNIRKVRKVDTLSEISSELL